MSYGTFALIKATIGLRVSDEDEEAGLDIVEHGMYGYPEQFIQRSDFGGPMGGPPEGPAHAPRGTAVPRPGEVTA
jgi:ammonium transporter, Amt family